MKYTLLIAILLLVSFKSHCDDAMGHSPDRTGGLDDSEKIISENFIHQGLTQETYNEACKGNEDICSGEDPKSTQSAMWNAIAKAYQVIISTSDGKINLGPKTSTDVTPVESAEQTVPTDKKPEDRKVSDYCKHIATASEAIATFKQVTAQTAINTPTGSETAQKDSLYKAARGHDARSETSKVQAIGFGSTAACYLGMITYGTSTGGGMAAAKSCGLKLAASTLLTGHFYKEIGRHKEYADKVKEIANKFPGKGDCNPVTEVDCYCSQESTKNDPKYCLSQIYQRAVAENSVIITCLDDQMKNDPECNCIKDDSCYDKHYINQIKTSGFGAGLTTPLYQSMKSITATGSLGQGTLATSGSLGKFAHSNKYMDKYDKNIKPPLYLSSEQQKEAEEFQKLGIPPNMASKMASFDVSPTTKNALGKLKSNYKYTYRSKNRTGKKSKILYFGGKGKTKNKYKKKNTSINDLLKRFGKKKKNTKNRGKVLTFAERARKQGQINRTGNLSLFEILSRRYQITGRRQFK